MSQLGNWHWYNLLTLFRFHKGLQAFICVWVCVHVLVLFGFITCRFVRPPSQSRYRTVPQAPKSPGLQVKPSLTQPLATEIWFLFPHLAFSRMSFKCNYTVCSLYAWLLSQAQCIWDSSRPGVYQSSFISMAKYNSTLCTTVCSHLPRLRNVWLISRLWQL